MRYDITLKNMYKTVITGYQLNLFQSNYTTWTFCVIQQLNFHLLNATHIIKLFVFDFLNVSLKSF